MAGEDARPQDDVSETHAREPAHLAADRLPQAAHLPIPPIPQQDMKPAVGALPFRFQDLLEAGKTVLQLDPPGQTSQCLPRYLPQDANCVFPLHLAGGMHETVGQLTVVGE